MIKYEMIKIQLEKLLKLTFQHFDYIQCRCKDLKPERGDLPKSEKDHQKVSSKWEKYYQNFSVAGKGGKGGTLSQVSPPVVPSLTIRFIFSKV